MTVKELCDLLDPEANGELPVFVRCRWTGEAEDHVLGEWDVGAFGRAACVRYHKLSLLVSE